MLWRFDWDRETSSGSCLTLRDIVILRSSVAGEKQESRISTRERQVSTSTFQSHIERISHVRMKPEVHKMLS